MSTLEFCPLRNAQYSFMAFLYELIPSYTFPFICRPGGSGRFILSSSFEYVRRYPIVSRLTFSRSIPKAVSIPLHRVMASPTELCSPKRCNSQFSKSISFFVFSVFCFHWQWGRQPHRLFKIPHDKPRSLPKHQEGQGEKGCGTTIHKDSYQ